jgi:hypothetical protein
MAKTTGPLFSLAARGSLGKVINFRGDGRNPVTTLHRSRPSRVTAESAANRLRASHAASAWHDLDTPTRQAWALQATSANLPAFGYYLQQWQLQAATLTNLPQIPSA